MLGWVVSRPFAWTWASIVYSYSLLNSTSDRAMKRRTEKEKQDAEKLTQRLQENLQNGEDKLKIAEEKRDELLAEARQLHKEGHSKQAVAVMRKVVEQRSVVEFLDGILAQTRQQVAHIERQEMTKELAEGQQELATVMDRARLDKQVDIVDDAQATIQEAQDDMRELSDMLSRPTGDEMDAADLLRELEGLDEIDRLDDEKRTIIKTYDLAPAIEELPPVPTAVAATHTQDNDDAERQTERAEPERNTAVAQLAP